MNRCFHNWVQQLRKMFVPIRFCKFELQLKVTINFVIFKIHLQGYKILRFACAAIYEAIFKRFEKEKRESVLGFLSE